MTIMKKAIVAAATASMILAPAAAQAKTRAGDNSPVLTSSVAKPGVGRSAKGEKVGGSSILIAILAAAAVVGAIVVATDGDDDASPGT
jgi:hypothetical protein